MYVYLNFEENNYFTFDDMRTDAIMFKNKSQWYFLMSCDDLSDVALTKDLILTFIYSYPFSQTNKKYFSVLEYVFDWAEGFKNT